MDDIKTMYQKVKEIFTTEHHIDLDTDNMLTEQLFTDYISSQLEPLVMQKIADIAEKALTQWKLHIEENEQTDLEDINHLESLEWKKLNAELQSIKSNFSA